jgi:hypothetical protein
MKESLLLLIPMLTLVLGSAWGQSTPKLEKAFASLTLKPGERAHLLKVTPSFETPLVFLDVGRKDGWTIQVERLARYTEVPTVELSFSIHMNRSEKTKFDPKSEAADWEDFLKEVRGEDPMPTAFDGISVELHTKMGEAKEITASINVARLPFGVPREQIAPGLDALLARLIEMTGILPRSSYGKAAVGIKQKYPHDD